MRTAGRPARGPRVLSYRVPASTSSATSLDVLGVDEAGTGEDRQAAAGGVEVRRLQVHEDDRQVALEVLLLVDGEGDVAVDSIAAITSGEMSKPPMISSRPADSPAAIARSGRFGPVPITASMSGSACRMAEIWFSCSVGSASRPTNSETTSPSNVEARPSHRSSRAMFVCSWRAQRIFVAPSSLKRSPAPSPATVSVWPMWVMAPSSS